MDVVISYSIYLLLFLTFLLAPIDITLNISVLGFNIRMGFLVMIILATFLGVVLVRDMLAKKQKISLPLYLVILLAVGILNLFFVPNSVYIPRGLIYALTLLLFAFLMMFLINTKNYFDFEKVLDIYILSFGIHALVGGAQFILFYGFGINFFVTQPGRINGFTYEPSYYVTYMSPGLIITLMMALYLNTNNKAKMIFYSLTASLILVVLIFSTSKLALVEVLIVLLLMVLMFLVLKVSQLLKNQNFTKNLMYLLAFTVVFSGIFYIGGNIGAIFKVISGSKGGVSYIKKAEEVVSTYKEASLDIRLSQFKETLQIALENPLIGKSLGGVAPYRALKDGTVPKSNEDVKKYEGMNIFAEMLAGFGVFGFLLMLGFIFLISYEAIALSLKVGADLGIISMGLMLGFLLELFLLMFNQNVLRLYLWVHISLLALVVEHIRGLVAS